VLRTFLLIVLMAIVPIRGAIGASMMLCGPGHDRIVAGAHDHGATPHAGDHHDHHGAPAQDHHDHGQTGDAINLGAHTCSLCAECCGGGAMLLPSALNLPVVAHVDDLFPPIFVHFERRPPDGLERPPHTPLV
jgi:hypothetical protein